MTIEQPELLKFIHTEYSEVIIDHAPTTMHKLIVKYGFPPLRQVRYCCWELKATQGKGRIKILGVRAEESPRRAKYKTIEQSTRDNSLHFNLILDWKSSEVWEYIRKYNLPYCKLYDEGIKRIGCVFCPFAKTTINLENAVRYPQFVRYFITACDRAIKNRIAKGKATKYKDGAEMFIKWIEGGRGKTLADLGFKFNFDKMIFEKAGD